MISKDTLSQIHFNLEMMDVTDLIAPCCPCTLQEALNFKMALFGDRASNEVIKVK